MYSEARSDYISKLASKLFQSKNLKSFNYINKYILEFKAINKNSFSFKKNHKTKL